MVNIITEPLTHKCMIINEEAVKAVLMLINSLVMVSIFMNK